MARSSKDALDAPFRRMRKQKEEEQAKTVRLCDEPGCKSQVNIVRRRTADIWKSIISSARSM